MLKRTTLRLRKGGATTRKNNQIGGVAATITFGTPTYTYSGTSLSLSIPYILPSSPCNISLIAPTSSTVTANIPSSVCYSFAGQYRTGSVTIDTNNNLINIGDISPSLSNLIIIVPRYTTPPTGCTMSYVSPVIAVPYFPTITTSIVGVNTSVPLMTQTSPGNFQTNNVTGVNVNITISIQLSLARSATSFNLVATPTAGAALVSYPNGNVVSTQVNIGSLGSPFVYTTTVTMALNNNTTYSLSLVPFVPSPAYPAGTFVPVFSGTNPTLSTLVVPFASPTLTSVTSTSPTACTVVFTSRPGATSYTYTATSSGNTTLTGTLVNSTGATVSTPSTAASAATTAYINNTGFTTTCYSFTLVANSAISASIPSAAVSAGIVLPPPTIDTSTLNFNNNTSILNVNYTGPSSALGLQLDATSASTTSTFSKIAMLLPTAMEVLR
jgi:hypothetical protein